MIFFTFASASSIPVQAYGSPAQATTVTTTSLLCHLAPYPLRHLRDTRMRLCIKSLLSTTVKSRPKLASQRGQNIPGGGVVLGEQRNSGRGYGEEAEGCCWVDKGALTEAMWKRQRDAAGWTRGLWLGKLWQRLCRRGRGMLLDGQGVSGWGSSSSGYEEEKEGYYRDSYALATSSNNTASAVLSTAYNV